MEYNILSPNKITIRQENFKTKSKARLFLIEWMARYKIQGYYSFEDERIPLKELGSRCEFIEIKK